MDLFFSAAVYARIGRLHGLTPSAPVHDPRDGVVAARLAAGLWGGAPSHPWKMATHRSGDDHRSLPALAIRRPRARGASL